MQPTPFVMPSLGKFLALNRQEQNELDEGALAAEKALGELGDRYREETKRLADFRRQLNAAEGQLRQHTKNDEPGDVDDLALKLIETGKIDLAESAQSYGKRRNLTKVVRIIERAIGRQEREVRSLEIQCAQLLRSKIEPEHQRLVTALAKALTEVAFANQRLTTFQEDAKEAAGTGFNPCFYALVGLPGDPNCGALLHINDLVSQGYLPKDDPNRMALLAELERFGRYEQRLARGENLTAAPADQEQEQPKPANSRKGKGKAAGDKNPEPKKTSTREEAQQRITQIETDLGTSASAAAPIVDAGMEATLPGRGNYDGGPSARSDGDDYE